MAAQAAWIMGQSATVSAPQRRNAVHLCRDQRGDTAISESSVTEAAFKACYSEWRMIKTRATVQLVFEIPIEQADAAYQALGGMPIAAKEVWCGIARLTEPVSRPVSQAEKQPGSASSPPAPPVRADKRKFDQLAPAQQAGILCGEHAFAVFLGERFTRQFEAAGYSAAGTVRDMCEVDSRADIRADNAQWSALVLAYRLWQREPEFIGAA